MSDSDGRSIAASVLSSGLDFASDYYWNSRQEQREDTSYQRSVADMKAAGLNPALMYGSASTTEANASSHSAYGSSAAQAAQIASGIALNKSQSNLFDAQADYYNKLGENTEADTSYKSSLSDYTDANKEAISIQNEIDKGNLHWLTDKCDGMPKDAWDALAGSSVTEQTVTRVNAGLQAIGASLTVNPEFITTDTTGKQALFYALVESGVDSKKAYSWLVGLSSSYSDSGESGDSGGSESESKVKNLKPNILDWLGKSGSSYGIDPISK